MQLDMFHILAILHIHPYSCFPIGNALRNTSHLVAPSGRIHPCVGEMAVAFFKVVSVSYSYALVSFLTIAVNYLFSLHMYNENHGTVHTFKEDYLKSIINGLFRCRRLPQGGIGSSKQKGFSRVY